MMCTGAVSTPTTGLMSLKEGLIDRHGVMGLTVGGVFGVAVAVYIVKSMSMSTLQWLVIVVVLYTSATMFRRATKESCRERQQLVIIWKQINIQIIQNKRILKEETKNEVRWNWIRINLRSNSWRNR